MKAGFSLKLFIILLISLLNPLPSRAYEMLGMISYNLAEVNPKPAAFTNSSNGIGYTFLGRMDLGPGLLESGFQFILTSITTQQTFGELKATGSYWILPLMYRYIFLPPFFSIAVGADYAVVGTNSLSVSGTQVNGLTSGYRSHFGAQISLEANQDLGENLSAVFDLRYRGGLANAISYGNSGSKYNFYIIGLGIQKHLE